MKNTNFTNTNVFLQFSVIIWGIIYLMLSCNPSYTITNLEKEVETRYIETQENTDVVKWIDTQIAAAESSKNSNYIINTYKAKAKYYQLIQRYDTAFIWHKKALDKAKKHNLNELIPKLFECLAYNQYMLNNKSLCIQYAKQSLELASLNKDTAQMGFAHRWLYMAENNQDDAISHLRNAEEFACLSKDKQLMVYVYNELGVLAWSNGKQTESLNYFNEVRKLAEEINDHDYLLLSFHNSGAISDFLGRYHDAYKYYRHGIFLAKKYKNKLFLARFYQKVAYNLCHYHYHQLSEAQEYIEKAEEAYQGFYDPRLEGNIPAVKGAILYKQKNYEDALAILHKAYKNASTAKAQVELGRICSDISLIYLDEGKNDSAIYYIDKAIKAYQDKTQKIGLQRAQLIQAKIYLNQHHHLKAKIQANDVLKKIDNSDNRNYLHLELGYEVLSKVYELEKNDKLALFYHKQITSIKDSIFSKDRAREVGKMQAEAELEKEIMNSQYKIQKLSKDIVIKNQRRNIILIVLVFITIMSIILFYVVMSYKTNNRKLSILNQKVTRMNEKLEMMVEMRTKQLKESHEKTIHVIQANSHDIRNHVARILGLAILYNNKLAETTFIMQNIEKSANELDEAVYKINEKLNEERDMIA